jgi:hypothetical protein
MMLNTSMIGVVADTLIGFALRMLCNGWVITDRWAVDGGLVAAFDGLNDLRLGMASKSCRLQVKSNQSGSKPT